MSVLGVVGFGAVACVVLGWLVVSFSPVGARRTVIEWISATFLYLALLALFVNLFLRARAEDSTAGLVAFGFLCALFGAGLVVSAFHTVSSLRPAKPTNPSATG